MNAATNAVPAALTDFANAIAPFVVAYVEQGATLDDAILAASAKVAALADNLRNDKAALAALVEDVKREAWDRARPTAPALTTLDATSTASAGIAPQTDGTFLALTLTASKSFKTAKGAASWLAARGYAPNGTKLAR